MGFFDKNLLVLGDEEKDTFGKRAKDHARKHAGEVANIWDLVDGALQNYEPTLHKTIADFKSRFPGHDKDFFIQVVVGMLPGFNNVPRYDFVARITCPVPEPNHTVYRIDIKTGDIHELWALPTDEDCEVYYNDRHKVDPSEWGLLSYVIAYKEGDLEKLSMKLNGIDKEIEEGKYIII